MIRRLNTWRYIDAGEGYCNVCREYIYLMSGEDIWPFASHNAKHGYVDYYKRGGYVRRVIR